MNTYRVLKVKEPMESLAGKRFSPVYDDYANIADYPWGDYYCPDARACVRWDEGGLWVTLCAREERISAHETQFGGPVCVDSCLEFFLNPCPAAQDKYVNVEVNARGTMHIGVGKERGDRRVLQEMPEDMRLSVSGHMDGWWAVRYYLSWKLLEELTGAPHEAEMRGNFYTCDESIHPHFGCWSPVLAPAPDFHRPEYFGKLEMI